MEEEEEEVLGGLLHRISFGRESPLSGSDSSDFEEEEEEEEAECRCSGSSVSQ